MSDQVKVRANAVEADGYIPLEFISRIQYVHDELLITIPIKTANELARELAEFEFELYQGESMTSKELIAKIEALLGKIPGGPILTEDNFFYQLNELNTNRFFGQVSSAGEGKASKEECEAVTELFASSPQYLTQLIDLVKRYREAIVTAREKYCYCYEDKNDPEPFICHHCDNNPEILEVLAL